MIRLVLIRGLPGSGKSTLAKTRFKDYIHLEADMYFINEKGYYVYNPDLIKEAHEWCLTTAKHLLWSGQQVVVSNTFSQLWEMYPYLDAVNRNEVQITEAQGNWPNVHGISEEKIQIMKDRWDILPYDDWEYIEFMPFSINSISRVQDI